MKNRELSRPDLVVPYQKQPLRDRAYPYVMATALIILTVLAIILNHITNVN